jgi:hypothetical protein
MKLRESDEVSAVALVVESETPADGAPVAADEVLGDPSAAPTGADVDESYGDNGAVTPVDEDDEEPSES